LSGLATQILSEGEILSESPWSLSVWGKQAGQTWSGRKKRGVWEEKWLAPAAN